MPISTLQGSDSSSKKPILSYIVVSVLVAVVVFLLGMLIKNILDLQGKTNLKVESSNGSAEVSINDKVVGNTPLNLSNLKPGETKIKLTNGANVYETSLEFSANSEVYINRDLGTSKMFSSGTNIWVEKNTTGTVATIISEPSNASVFIDNNEVGKTPYSSNNLPDDTYDIRIDSAGYESQTARVKIQKGFTLNLSVKLFPMPTPNTISLLEGSSAFYNGSVDNQAITADTQAWVRSLMYWNSTRGLNISGQGVVKETVFDYYLDHMGNVFDKAGNRISAKEDLDKLKDAKSGLYLGKTSDGAGISDTAKETLKSFGQLAMGEMVKVKATPTGWLRVREQPNLNGAELARVNVGGQYQKVEEQTGWVKIKVSDTIMGWVSADYVEKIN